MRPAASASMYPSMKDTLRFQQNRPNLQKKPGHHNPVTQLSDLLWQPGDPPAADPWLSVSRLLGVWLFHETFFGFILIAFPEHAITRPNL
jgi:hypothetical protein